MRIRTILAAAAAPAALAAILLGTAGQASAQVKPVTYSANAHEQNVTDTTISGLPGDATVNDPVYGPVWAHDNIERKLVATQDPSDPTKWHVQITSQGSYDANANPLDGKSWNGHGSFTGYVNYLVTSKDAPSGTNLPSQLSNTLRSSGIVAKWFNVDPSAVQGESVPGQGNYSFDYNSIPVPGDQPTQQLHDNGITFGVGPNGQHMVQVG